MADRSVKVRLWASTSEYEASMKRAKGATTDLGGAIDKTSTDGSAKVGMLSTAWGRVGTAAVAAGALSVLKGSIDAASNLEESINAVTVTYGENADAVLAIGENSAEAFGLSQSAFNGFAVQFSAFAKQVAEKDGRAVADVLGEMTGRIADFASVMNLDLNEAAQVFMSTMAGETEPIRRFGIDVSAATVETYALANGLIKSKSEMTEAIKVQARYGLLMAATADTSGDFANTADSLANSQRTLSAEWEDASAQLGQTLAPALATVVGGLVEILGVLDKIKVLDAISLSWVEPLGKMIGEVLSPWGNEERDANKAIVDAFTNAEKAAASFDQTLLANITTFADARAVALEYANGIDGLEDVQTAANLIALEWNGTTETSAAEMGAAEEAARLYADGLRANAREASYNADANDEMGRIQRITTAAVEAATAAQDAFMESIKFTRDEVGALRGEIENRQAWHDLQDTFETTRLGLEDQNTTMREAAQLSDNLRLKVLDYAESIHLPDSVTTQLIALIDQGEADQVEALLARWADGITLPIKPYIINTGTGTSVRVDENGNLRATARAAGGPTSPGHLYEVAEGGKSEMLYENGRSYLLAAQSGYVVPFAASAAGQSAPGNSTQTVTGVHVETLIDNSGESLDNMYRAANAYFAMAR